MESSQPAQRQAHATEIQDDPKARTLLQRAYASAYRWPAGLAGFTALITCLGSGRPLTGRLTARLPKDLTVTLDDEWAQGWVQGQVSSIVIHRSPRAFEEADGRFILTLGADDGHPLGRLVQIHGDGMGSRYRVRDDRIMQITRAMGPMRFSINVFETAPTPDGRQLVSRYLVYYFAPAANTEQDRLAQVEHYHDRYVAVEGVMLPATRQVMFTRAGEVMTVTLAFTEHRLL